jgi:transposase
MEAGTLSI